MLRSTNSRHHRVRITISGMPGSGKSTVARILTERLGCTYVNGGQIFRDAATARGMRLAEYATYVGEHPAIDRELDDELLQRARAHEDLILESRLAGWLTMHAGIPALRIWITADEETRVARLMRRDGGTHEEAIARLRARASGEAERYLRTYGLDLHDESPYDAIIRTDDRTPENVAEEILRLAATHHS